MRCRNETAKYHTRSRKAWGKDVHRLLLLLLLLLLPMLLLLLLLLLLLVMMMIMVMPTMIISLLPKQADELCINSRLLRDRRDSTIHNRHASQRLGQADLQRNRRRCYRYVPVRHVQRVDSFDRGTGG